MISNILFLRRFSSLTSFVHYFLLMHYFLALLLLILSVLIALCFVCILNFAFLVQRYSTPILAFLEKLNNCVSFVTLKVIFFWLKYHHVMKYLDTHKAPFWVIYGCTTWLAKAWYNELWLVRSTCCTQLYHCLDWREVPDNWNQT